MCGSSTCSTTRWTCAPPAIGLGAAAPKLSREFAAARERLRASAEALSAASGRLAMEPDRREQPMTSVAELAKAGLVTIHQAPFRFAADGGELPVLTAADLASGGPPSGRAAPGRGMVALAPGDVVLAPSGTVRVLAADDPALGSPGGVMLGPQLTAYRVDAERLDPYFLAGFLRFASVLTPTRPGTGRADARRARIPRLPLPEQRAYGAAFRDLLALEDGLRQTAALGETLVRLGFEGLADGHLRPPAREG